MKISAGLVFISLFFSCSNNIHKANKGSEQKFGETKVSVPPKIIQVEHCEIIKADNPTVKVAGQPRMEPASFFAYSNRINNERCCSVDEGVFDKKGNLWFDYFIEVNTEYVRNAGAIVAEGLCCFDGKNFYTYTTRQGLPDSSTGPLLMDKNGSLWIGNDIRGVTCFNGKSFTNYDTSQGLADNYVMSIFQDNNEIIWFGTGKGLCAFDGRNFSTYKNTAVISKEAFQSIQQDSNNHLWLGTMGKGVYCFDGKKIIAYTTEQGLPGNYFESDKSIIKDEKGNMWFLTWPWNVSKLQNNKFITFNTSNGLANHKIFSFFEASNGNFWFGGNDTVICYDKKEFKTYCIAKDTDVNSIEMIIQDSVNNLYFGSSKRGIIKYDGKKFESLFQ